MKNKKMILVSIITTLFLFTTGCQVEAIDGDYGSNGAEEKQEFTLEEMLEYALEDEILAYTKYQLIIQEFGEQRPFTNIMKAELHHIDEVETLYETYGFDLPEVDVEGYVIVPSSIEAALSAGVEAEIENIAMYDKFLALELPEDVREVFEALKAASQNHLEAFRKDRNGGNGQGFNAQSNQGTGQNKEYNRNENDDCDDEKETSLRENVSEKFKNRNNTRA